MSCWRSNRASQNPSRPASKATQTRRTTRPTRRDSSRQRSINLNSCSGSGGSFFSGSRASPGARAATSQLDWLISMTTINVLSGSRTARDLLKSKGLDMERSIVGFTAAMVHYFRRPPHSISPASGRGGQNRRRAALVQSRIYQLGLFQLELAAIGLAERDFAEKQREDRRCEKQRRGDLEYVLKRSRERDSRRLAKGARHSLGVRSESPEDRLQLPCSRGCHVELGVGKGAEARRRDFGDDVGRQRSAEFGRKAPGENASEYGDAERAADRAHE